MAGPDVRYANNAGINIAYQVFGEGSRDPKREGARATGPTEDPEP